MGALWNPSIPTKVAIASWAISPDKTPHVFREIFSDRVNFR